MIDVLLNAGQPLTNDPRFSESALATQQVVILDVLRATSTIVTSLNAGARAVQLFDSLDAARAARSAWNITQKGPSLLAGELSCKKPADFDLGNSPREHLTEKVGGATVLLATTNGTRAAVRAEAAKKLFAAALLNATATAEALLPDIDKLDTVLWCSGTGGKLAFDDVLGAGAICFAILQTTHRVDLLFSDSAWLAYHAFSAVRQRLPAALRLGQSGINIIDAGLEDDIDACARLDSIPFAVRIDATPSGLQAQRA